MNVFHIFYTSYPIRKLFGMENVRKFLEIFSFKKWCTDRHTFTDRHIFNDRHTFTDRHIFNGINNFPSLLYTFIYPGLGQL